MSLWPTGTYIELRPAWKALVPVAAFTLVIDRLQIPAEESALLASFGADYEAYRDTVEKHGLKPPPGYGVAGAGNAVFSVSSFMDTLAPEVVTTEEAVPA